LDISKIQKTLGFKINININPKNKTTPGQSRLHYSPGIPLNMNIKKPKSEEAFILIKKRKNKSKNYFYLSKKNNLNEAAKNLYSCLRKIRNKGYKSIAVEKIPNRGLGKVINDRLNRASKY
jgi:L-threonylcarbamoyladenylate synthase